MTSPATRPRLLVVLAVVGVLYGSINTLSSVQTLLAFAGSQDTFTRGQREAIAALFANEKIAPGDTDLDTIATRQAQTLWARRNVLAPLAGATLISALLVLLGSLRTVTRGEGRRWGRSAWQLGAIVGLPSVVLGALTSRAHSDDMRQAITDLKGPIVDALRAQSTDGLIVTLAVTVGLYLLSVAVYLESPPVRRWTDEQA